MPQLPNDDGWADVPSKPPLKAKVADADWADVPMGGTGTAAAPPAPTPPPKRGMLDRFGRGLRTSMGFEPEGTFRGDLSQIGEGLKDEFTHPIESGKALLEGMGESQQEVIDKAYQEQQSPNLATKVKGYVRGAESAVPLVGPWLSHAGDTFSEGDIAGGMGEMTPGLVGASESGDVPLRTRVGNFAAEKLRTPEGALKPNVRAVAHAGGALAGYSEGGWPMGAAGGVAGPALVDMVVPDRATGLPKFKPTPWEPPPEPVEPGAPLPSSSEFYEQRGEDIMRRGKEQTALDKGARSEAREAFRNRPGVPESGTGKGAGAGTGQSLADSVRLTKAPIRETPFTGPLTPEQVPGKPQLRGIAATGDPRAGQELMRRGERVLYTPEDMPSRGGTLLEQIRGEGGDTAPGTNQPAPVSTEAGDSGTGGQYSGPERRGSVRDIGTEDPMRTARMSQIRQTLSDPDLDLRDRIVLQRQLDDMKANPFERTNPGEVDIKAAKAKNAPKMSKEEATAASEKRKAGRSKRFGKEPVPND